MAVKETITANEASAARAFGKQAAVFDRLYGHDTVINYKRTRVRAHIENYLSPGARILELNAGTGEDAVYFARRGYHVHATDAAAQMLAILHEKKQAFNLNELITHEVCDFTGLRSLRDRGPYDAILSNFAGLNCTQQLDKVLHSLTPLVKINGTVTLVILPRFCLWESLLLFRGKFRTALRRFSGRKGSAASVEGEPLQCWYYNPSFIVNHMKKDFDLLNIEGLCTFVPPSYLLGFAEKYPAFYRWLVKLEDRYKSSWPWKYTGDYYIISLRRK